MHKQDTHTLRKEVQSFLKRFRAATIATADSTGRPHAATVYCVVDDDLNVYFTTSTKGRKYENLMARPEVAMVITDENNMATVQLSGIAKSLEGTEIESEIFAELWRLRFDDTVWPIPPIRLFEQGFSHEMTAIQVRPTEMVFARFVPREAKPPMARDAASGKYATYFQQVSL